jgi:hypothetical protein
VKSRNLPAKAPPRQPLVESVEKAGRAAAPGIGKQSRRDGERQRQAARMPVAPRTVVHVPARGEARGGRAVEDLTRIDSHAGKLFAETIGCIERDTQRSSVATAGPGYFGLGSAAICVLAFGKSPVRYPDGCTGSVLISASTALTRLPGSGWSERNWGPRGSPLACSFSNR